jgi:hypothetical protein
VIAFQKARTGQPSHTFPRRCALSRLTYLRGDGGGNVSPTDNYPDDDEALEKRVLAALGRADGLHSVAERLVGALLRLDLYSSPSLPECRRKSVKGFCSRYSAR